MFKLGIPSPCCNDARWLHTARWGLCLSAFFLGAASGSAAAPAPGHFGPLSIRDSETHRLQSSQFASKLSKPIFRACADIAIEDRTGAEMAPAQKASWQQEPAGQHQLLEGVQETIRRSSVSQTKSGRAEPVHAYMTGNLSQAVLAVQHELKAKA